MPLPPEIELDGELYRSMRDGARMVRIPSGVWQIGARRWDLFAEHHSKPRHRVALAPFLIDLTPVTCQQFRLFIAAGGYQQQELWNPVGWQWRHQRKIELPAAWLHKPGWDRPDFPVAGVSWYEADAYARWCGRSLPSEAQWERAAGGPEALRFPWGDSLPDSETVNFDDRLGRISAVTDHPCGRSPEGLYDMAGNVNNWCRDWYDPEGYLARSAEEPARDPCDDADTQRRWKVPVRRKVDKGGGYLTSALRWEVLTCVGKTAWVPESREPWNGFRCALRLEA